MPEVSARIYVIDETPSLSSEGDIPVGALCSVQPGASGGAAGAGLCVDFSIVLIESVSRYLKKIDTNDLPLDSKRPLTVGT